jgi:hypothetical protein
VVGLSGRDGQGLEDAVVAMVFESEPKGIALVCDLVQLVDKLNGELLGV